MCVLSAVLDYGRNVPAQTWTVPNWIEYQELLEKARKWDALAGQPDCEDPLKEEWMRAIEERISILEKKKKKQFAIIVRLGWANIGGVARS